MEQRYFSILQDAGIRPSIQRIAIYKYLCEKHNHPTADTVHKALESAYPTLSRTTCYNTLKLFEEKNIIQSIQIEDEAVRYDADISDHLHFKCINCLNVFDMFIKDKDNYSNSINTNIANEFNAIKIQTNIWGTCPQCS